MERSQGEAVGYTFMLFGVVMLLLQETGVFSKEYEWTSIASMLGGLVVGAASSWHQHSNRRLPVQDPKDLYDPMQEKRRGTYQW